jgi:5-methyltetrahydrofolate--homocysteine methyltransferase
MNLLDELQKRVLIADGATGSQLQKAGLPTGYPPELWNVEQPGLIYRHYMSYLDAGSDIILTNTFGGSPIKLAAEKLSHRTAELNLAAARLARKAAGNDHFVLGDVGPTGKILSPLGDLSAEDTVSSFQAQIQALVDGGVDAILIETMSALEEAQAAVKAARLVTDVPVIVTFSFDTHGRTMMGLKPEKALNDLWDGTIQGIGANCGRTLDETLTAIQSMKKAQSGVLLMAKPNAGMPSLEHARSVYDVSPETMADYAGKFLQEGVRIFGGCCGTTPDHIKAVKKAIG